MVGTVFVVSIAVGRCCNSFKVCLGINKSLVFTGGGVNCSLEVFCLENHQINMQNLINSLTSNV